MPGNLISDMIQEHDQVANLHERHPIIFTGISIVIDTLIMDAPQRPQVDFTATYVHDHLKVSWSENKRFKFSIWHVIDF